MEKKNPIKMTKNELVQEVVELRKQVNTPVDAQERNTDDKSELVEQLNAEISEKDNTISRQRETIHEQTKELQTLRSQVTSIRNDAQGMESRIAELTNANSSLKAWKYVAIGVCILLVVCVCVMCA